MLSLLLGLLACSGSSGPADQEGQSESLAEQKAKLPFEELSFVEGVVKGALEEAGQPGGPLSWTVPKGDCSLSYDYELLLTAEVAQVNSSLENEMELSGWFSLRGDSEDQFLITWHDVLIEDRQGGQSQRKRESRSKNLPTNLSCQTPDCLMLTEVGGPSSMWVTWEAFWAFCSSFRQFGG